MTLVTRLHSIMLGEKFRSTKERMVTHSSGAQERNRDSVHLILVDTMRAYVLKGI